MRRRQQGTSAHQKMEECAICPTGPISLPARLADTFPMPPNEVDRKECLDSLRNLDSPSENQFDRITSLASTVFNCPIALVSFVDSERQCVTPRAPAPGSDAEGVAGLHHRWFKSNLGLGDVQGTHRNLAFCAHAIMVSAREPASRAVGRTARARARACDNVFPARA